jgi:hypothetical protein
MTLELLWLLQLKEASPSLNHRPQPHLQVPLSRI